MLCVGCIAVHAPFRQLVRNSTLHELAERIGWSEEALYCEGCRSSKVAEFCRDCYFKHCISKQKISSCSDCDEFPCVHIQAFKDDEWAHHTCVVENLEAIRTMGVEIWLTKQAERWSCPVCNIPFSWYDSICEACGAKLSNSTADDARIRAGG